MKLLGKSKDETIDGLLRAYVSRTGNLPRACPNFDPDLANAYIERSLPADSRSRYEQHLSECGACRKNVIALARIAEAESVASISKVRGEGSPAWPVRIVRGFAGLTAPQWATAVAAVIVLAISVPLILSRNEFRTSQDTSTPNVASPQRSEPQSADQIAQAGAPAAVQQSPTNVAASTPTQSGKREAETIAANTPPSQPSAVGGVSGDVRADSLKAKAAQSIDAVQAKTERRASDAAAGAGAASETQLAKSDSDKKRDQQKEGDSTQPSESKAAGAGGQAGKEIAKTAEEMPPPPAPRSTSEPASPRKAMKQPRGKLGLRDSAASETGRLPEKKIGSKRFSLRDDVWTDKDYDPDKNLPVVNIVRDSNVYKELLDKQAGLKAYLDAFHEGERAIIVYKDKVYKLIPQ